MKQSSNFEEVVKSILVSEEKKTKPQPEKKKIVKEATSFGSPASLSVSQGSRGNMPPFSTYTDDMAQNAGSIDMRDIDQAQDSKAPGRPPFPLETIIDHIAHSYQSLMHAEELVHGTFKNPVLSEAQLEELKSSQEKIKSALGNIKATLNSIRKITID